MGEMEDFDNNKDNEVDYGDEDDIEDQMEGTE